MKRIISIISFAAAALAAVSCVEPLDSLRPRQDLTLSFSCGVMTKAEPVEEDGVDNENLIKKIDYFIFPLNEDGGVDDDAEYVYNDTFTPDDNGLNRVYQEKLNHDLLATIFPDGATKMMLFAVANYVDKWGTAVDSPGYNIPEDANTWAELHNLEVGETFFYDDGNPNFQLRWPRKMDPDDNRLFFVMTGEEVIELKAEANVIPLYRLASKVTVNYTFEKSVYDAASGITWVPDYEGSQVRTYLSNAIEHTTLGAPFTSETNLVADSWDTATQPLGNGKRDIFEYAYDFLNPAPAYGVTPTPTIFAEDENGRITSDKVFHYYTYPIDLVEGDDNQPYLKLVLPWYGYKNYGTTNPILYKQKEVYYKIVIPREGIKDPNRIYEYNVTVDIVDNEKEVEITGYDYIVKDWLANNEISANVAAGRYISLDIPKDEYDMYVDKLDISFVSSGTVIAHVDSIYQLNLSGLTVTKDEFMRDGAVVATPTLRNAKGITNADILGWVTIPEEKSYLEINHAMDNRMMINNQKNTAFDMAPYVFKVTLHLVEAGDDTSFDRTVTITQYPSLYVQARPSNGYVYVNGYYNRSSTNASQDNSTYWAFDDSKPNYVPNNGGQNSYVLGSVTGIGQNLGNSNNNTNMYAISVSILTETDYIVGDPRGDVEQLSNLGLNGNYHPARSDDEVRNVVSPYFLVSSAYSKTILWIRDFERAEKRCAAFQEAGYPAGRWRLPTEGEISFMVELSTNGFIPSLFMGCPYWASSGRLYNPNTKQFITAAQGANIGDNGVRCIYDLWHWGDEPNEDKENWLGFHD